MKRFKLSNLIYNDRMLLIMSLVLAFLCWIAVVIIQQPETNKTVRNVPIQIDLRADVLSELGLNAIGEGDLFVDVTVRGPYTVVGGLKPENLTVTASITEVSEPRIYDLPLTLVNENRGALEGVTLVEFSPSTVKVRFDRLVTKTFDIEPVVHDLATEEGFIYETPRATPAKVTITGPQADLDKIERAVIEVDLNGNLTRTYVSEQPIKLYNAQGDEVDTGVSHLTLDNEQSQLMVRVLKLKTLPLVVDFTNVPQNFPREDLNSIMYLSDDEIELAAPVDIIDNYQELHIGTIDLKTLTLENNLFEFVVELPSNQFTNINNITNVVVEFDTSLLGAERFGPIELSLENIPVGYNVNLITQQLSSVTVVGKQAILSGMTSGDIMAVVDLSVKEVVPGQYTYPVRVTVPTKGFVWATRDYEAIIQVTEKVTG